MPHKKGRTKLTTDREVNLAMDWLRGEMTMVQLARKLRGERRLASSAYAPIVRGLRRAYVLEKLQIKM